MQALNIPFTIWNNVTNNTSTSLVIYTNDQFPPLSTYPYIGLLSKDPLRILCIWHSNNVFLVCTVCEYMSNPYIVILLPLCP